MLELRALHPRDAQEIYACLQDMPTENGFMNDAWGMSWQDFEANFLPERLAAARGEGLLPGYVPETWYFLWDGTRAVALFKLRHFLNDALRAGAGHIGYAVRRSERGKGYATQGLALLLPVARSIVPEDEAWLSVSRQNPASLRVMLKNGGAIHHEDDQEYYVRIRL